MINANSVNPSHYVYLYRDTKGKPRYVGYGKGTSRASDHLSESHNPALNDFLAHGKYTLEIAGPFGTEETARAVETALISALQPEYNRDPGQPRWRFRPLGVPEHFAHRLGLPPLTRVDFLQQDEGTHRCPVLFVRISGENFEDGRVGYDPATPPTDDQILERMDRWWQLGQHVAAWRVEPERSPAVVVGVHGKPGAQIVIGTVNIDRSRWATAQEDGGYYQIPTSGPRDLDALELRGRRISADARIKFGSFSRQSFIILGCDSMTTGGHPALRELLCP